MLVALMLAACSTSYTSAGADGAQSRIIVGDEDVVFRILRTSVKEEFPGDAVAGDQFEHEISWSHQPLADRTTFVLKLSKVTGTNSAGVPVSGYSYRIDAHGTQFAVASRYVDPLTERISRNLQAANVNVAVVTSMKAVSTDVDITALRAEARKCFDSLPSNPAITHIATKVATIGQGEPSFLVLTDSTKPTQVEKDEIRTFGALRDECYRNEKKVFATQPAVIRDLLASSAAAQQNVVADLYDGALTYGEYARKAVALNVEADKAIDNVQAELKRQSADSFARAEQISSQARQALDARRATFMQNMQPNTPVNCYKMGNMVSCY